MIEFIMIVIVFLIATIVLLITIKRKPNSFSNTNNDSDLLEPGESIPTVITEGLFFDMIDEGKKSKFAFKMQYKCFEYIDALLSEGNIPYNFNYNIVHDLRGIGINTEKSFASVEVIEDYYIQTIGLVNNFISSNDFGLNSTDFNLNLE